jgi:hypothetical protein
MGPPLLGDGKEGGNSGSRECVGQPLSGCRRPVKASKSERETKSSLLRLAKDFEVGGRAEDALDDIHIHLKLEC